ncbi:hypothetical protein QQS21_005070 [Conoideocrella luteorostrata]|uniref:SMP-30/Gluconolactonase/LRE-like region domain-containing protein n=1 Tax=Conoideocrella luteorostrata TaxID=1105319 RepID=A0AAJ0FZC4_9HYPO|nr:hypothetical protein QQS21_005070 [Conoideocrella luteorostrata]
MRAFCGLVASLLAIIAIASGEAPAELPHRLVHQFPVGTWIENLAVRANGNLLLTTLFPNASLYEVARPESNSPAVKLLFTIDSVTSLLGIAEVFPDKFAFLGGNVNPTTGGIKGTWGVWTADFSRDPSPKPNLAVSLPDASLPNGLTFVPGLRDVALAADSTNGLVYRANVQTGKAEVSQDYPEMKPASGGPGISIGINGLHIHKGYLYFSNSATHTLFKIKVNVDGTTAPGAKVETVHVFDSTFLDDFAFGPEIADTAWLINNQNSVVTLEPNGYARLVAGGPGSATVPTDTACEFGRGLSPLMLYVATAGDSSQGGKIEAIDTSKYFEQSKF